MDREMLFRGKRLDDGEWVYGYLSKWPTRGWKNLSTIIVPEDGLHDGMAEQVEVDLNTIGQYVGLTDKNGQKVFEGDILAFYSDYHEKEIVDGVVKYGEFNCTCCDGVYGWYIDGGDIRKLGDTNTRLYVVGNIHDNPELLESK